MVKSSLYAVFLLHILLLRVTAPFVSGSVPLGSLVCPVSGGITGHGRTPAVPSKGLASANGMSSDMS